MLSRIIQTVIIVAIVFPSIRVSRSVEAYPTELLETEEDTTPSVNMSWQLGQLLDEVDVHRREEALENLQKMFGIRSQIEKKSTRHKIPPQFMMELYKTIADPSGVTRGKNPYNAKIVRSFIERESSLSHLYLFNISGLEINESVLEAELHLYRKRANLKVIHPKILSSPYYLIRVYQVLEGKSMNEPDLHRLLNVHYVGAHASGWQVFNVKQAVLAWVSGVPNLGLIVTASTLFGDEVSIEFSRRNEYHHSKQPILVLFDDDEKDSKMSKSDDNIVSHYYTYDNEPEELQPHTIIDNSEENIDSSAESMSLENLHRLKRHHKDPQNLFPYAESQITKEQNYGTQLVNNLGIGSTENLRRHERLGKKHSFETEAEDKDEEIVKNLFRQKRGATYKFPHKNIVSERKTKASQVLASMDIYERAMLRENGENKVYEYFKRDNKDYHVETREKRSAKVAEMVEETLESHANTRENRTECGRHELYVDFKEIGLSSSIIAPKGYSAYHCQGPCNSPLSQEQQPTNHATVQGIVHKMGLVEDVHMPCCVPTKLLSTTILFFDDNENVILKVYEDMIADRCGCR